jgi:hypothetical protein
MPDNQTIIVTQKNEGCLSGCGTTLAVLLLVGLAIAYWYVALPIAVVAAGVGIWYWHRQQAALPAAVSPSIVGAPAAQMAAPAQSAGTVVCSNCSAPVAGNFCAECGTAQTRSCADCGQRGLTSPFCPECGAATYLPPSP